MQHIYTIHTYKQTCKQTNLHTYIAINITKQNISRVQYKHTYAETGTIWSYSLLPSRFDIADKVIDASIWQFTFYDATHFEKFLMSQQLSCLRQTLSGQKVNNTTFIHIVARRVEDRRAIHAMDCSPEGKRSKGKPWKNCQETIYVKTSDAWIWRGERRLIWRRTE